MSCAECTSGELATDWTCLKCGVCLHDKCIEHHRANKAETTHSIIPKMDACMAFSVLDNFIDDLKSIEQRERERESNLIT